MILEIVGIILSTVIVRAYLPSGSGMMMAYIIDAPTLICMLIIILPVLLKKGLAKDFGRAFGLLKKEYKCSFSELRHTLDVVEMMQKQVLCAGCIVVFQGIFLFLHSLSDWALLGPTLSVAILAFFYTAILELLLLPLQIEAKRRIVDYMDSEQDDEEVDEVQSGEAVNIEQDSEKA